MNDTRTALTVPDPYAEDGQAAEAYAAGYADGAEGTPYRHDPRQHRGASVWALTRLAYRAGFRAGDPERRPVAVAHLQHQRRAAAAEVLRIGSLPRLVAEWPEGERHTLRPGYRARLVRILRTGRMSHHLPRPTVEAFARVLGDFAAGAGPYRASCPDVCGADDGHLETLDAWREAWAWLTRQGLPRSTPEAYADDLETGHAAAPDGRRAPAPQGLD